MIVARQSPSMRRVVRSLMLGNRPITTPATSTYLSISLPRTVYRHATLISHQPINNFWLENWQIVSCVSITEFKLSKLIKMQKMSARIGLPYMKDLFTFRRFSYISVRFWIAVGQSKSPRNLSPAVTTHNRRHQLTDLPRCDINTTIAAALRRLVSRKSCGNVYNLL